MQRLAASSITYVSVGHRPTLKAYHNTLLQLSAGNSREAPAQWRVEPVTEAVRATTQ